MPNDLLTISNAGPDILATNFWQLPMARAGKFFLSTNAGAFRLLVPALHVGSLKDMRAATLCVRVTRPLPREALT